jgi:transcriptional regulator with XRE-family HTH domain
VKLKHDRHPDQVLTLKQLGANIRKARQAANLTIGQLASLSNVAKGNISKVERGSNPSVLTLYRLAWSLGLSVVDLLPGYMREDPREVMARNLGLSGEAEAYMFGHL